MNVAVILAGGMGNRMRENVPKQFVEVQGKPVLAYTLEHFEAHPKIDAILVVCLKPYMDSVWKLKERFHFSKLTWVTEGGSTLLESAWNGVRYLKDKIDRKDLVLLHLGASPFLTGEIISDSIRVCREKGNAISATDFYLTSAKKASTASVSDPENYTEEYLDRDTLAIMNTPHTFEFGFLYDLYTEAIQSGVIHTAAPQTTSLVLAMGKPIYFSLGSQRNIKLTRKEDLRLLEGYALEQMINSNEQHQGDVVVFLADGFEECEALLAVDLLRRAGLKVVMASVMGRRLVTSSRHIPVVADCLAEIADYETAKMVFLPGGRLGTENLGRSEIVKEQCRAFASDKYVAAICAAPSILASLGLLAGKRATVHPDFADAMGDAVLTGESVAVDGHIITGQGLGATFPFAFTLIDMLVSPEMTAKIRNDICYQ